MSAELKVVAYGYENTRPTGERHALMMVKLDNASDQYPELATPLVRLSDAQSALQEKEAEIAALKEDAERYRWLRHGDNDEKVLMVYDTNGSRPFDHRYDEAWLPRNEALDAAIDSAKEKNHG